MVYIIEHEGEIVGVCDNELDVLRCLKLRDMIDLDKVNEELTEKNPEYHDVWGWLSGGATVDDLSQFLEEGNCYSLSLNYDAVMMKSFELRCKEELDYDNYEVRFPNGETCAVKAAFPEEAEALAERFREEDGKEYLMPVGVSRQEQTQSHDDIRRDEEGKFFPQTKEDLVELVRDEFVHLGSINTSRITDMSYLFSTFNERTEEFDLPERRDYSGIETWDVSNAESMKYMFQGARSFNQSLDRWDVSNVKDMDSMFDGAKSFNQPLALWDVSHVENMSYMFSGASSFDCSIGSWDVSRVKDMSHMFDGAESFNQPLNSWDVSHVKDMAYMFDGAESFNQPLDQWDVSCAENMYGMFSGAVSFNQPLDSWDVSQVKNMGCMFFEARKFNQPLDDWDVSQVKNMNYMFQRASSFNQSLETWDISHAKHMLHMFDSTPSFDKNLLKKTAEAWEKKNKDCSKVFKKALRDKASSAGR